MVETMGNQFTLSNNEVNAIVQALEDKKFSLADQEIIGIDFIQKLIDKLLKNRSANVSFQPNNQ